jgi:GT2 family glycosyltransferase
MPTLTPTTISIVIASHRANSIAACLSGLEDDLQSDKGVEVIVVADYAIDGFAEQYPVIQWVHHGNRGISAKRNKGIARASGTIVGFIDDDCIPLTRWIEEGAGYLERNGEYAGVAGQTCVERIATASYPLKEFERLEKPGFRTNNIFYRKNILVAVGGFDERFTVQREDVDLAFSILLTGWAIGYCAEAKVLHCHRANEPWDLLKNCKNRRFDPLLYKKHHVAYREWIGTPFTPSITLMLILHVVTGLSFSTGNAVVWGVAALTDAACAAGMAIRRNGITAFHGKQIARDILSSWLSPFVLVGALLLGSVRYRKLLLW